MNLTTFCNTYHIGQTYSYNGYAGECVTLVKLYIKNVLNITPKSIGNAKEYWLKRNSEKYLYDNFTFHNTPKRGDIFCRTSGTYGHVGIVISVSNGTYKTYEQNHNGNKVVGSYSYNLNNGFNFLRPKNRTNIDTSSSSSITSTDDDDSESIPTHDTIAKNDLDIEFIILKLLNIL